MRPFECYVYVDVCTTELARCLSHVDVRVERDGGEGFVDVTASREREREDEGWKEIKESVVRT